VDVNWNWKLYIDSREKSALDLCRGSMDKGDGGGHTNGDGDGYGYGYGNNCGSGYGFGYGNGDWVCTDGPGRGTSSSEWQ
jgi:hypothetical protein